MDHNTKEGIRGFFNALSSTGLHIDKSDPFAAMVNSNIIMMRQDVSAMGNKLFEIIDSDESMAETIQIPPILMRDKPGCQFGHGAGRDSVTA